MKIAFTSKGAEMNSAIDPRFGRSEYLLILDTKDNSLMAYDNRDISKEAHGAGPKTAQKLFDLRAEILITGNGPGGNALSVLEKVGIGIYVGAGDMTVNEAYEAYKNNQLKMF